MKKEINDKAYELGKKYFPNANNIWARANIEAQYVSSACTEMAEWMQKQMIDKACRCFCDDICDKGRVGMCYHKHDGKGQVKNTFRYNECNELKLMRKAMEE